jgi:phage gp29-like protein
MAFSYGNGTALVEGKHDARSGVFFPSTGEVGKKELIDPATGRPFKKRGQYDDFPLPNVITEASLISSAWRTYMHQWDESVRKCREDALAMRRDSFMMGLLQERKLACSGLKWHIEVDNKKDPTQKAIADGLQRIISSISRFQQFRYYMLESIWYGRYGAQLRLGWKMMDLPAPNVAGGGQAVSASTQRMKCLAVIPGYPDHDDPGHLPINGDKIGHSWDHTAYVMVNAAYDNQLPVHPPAPQPIWSTYAKAQPLKGELREQFVINKHTVDDADFFNAEMAEAIHGVGIRSVMYFLWWMRDEWLAQISDIIERTAWGIRLWYYTGGNTQSQQAVAKAAENNTNKMNILIPRFSLDGKTPQEGMEIKDLPTQGLEFVRGMVEWIDRCQERFVVGQSMSSGADDESGLGGTGRAKFAQQTKYQIVKFDAANFDDTLSTDLVRVIQKYTYPDLAEVPARFVTEVDDPNTKEWVEGVKTFVDLGGDAPMATVGERLGIPPVEEGEPALSAVNKAMGEMEVQKDGQSHEAGLQQQAADGDHRRNLEQGDAEHRRGLEASQADHSRQMELQSQKENAQRTTEEMRQAHQKALQEQSLIAQQEQTERERLAEEAERKAKDRESVDREKAAKMERDMFLARFEFDKNQKRDADGKWTSEGGSESEVSAPATETKPESDVHSEADTKAEEILTKTGGTSRLGKIGQWLASTAAAKYRQLEERYGRKTTIAILAASVITFPVPGNITAIVGIAELYRKLKGKKSEPEQHDRLSLPECFQIDKLYDDAKEEAERLAAEEAEMKLNEQQSERLMATLEKLTELLSREQPAPVVNVPAPVVHVSQPEQKKKMKIVHRNADGLIERIEELE